LLRWIEELDRLAVVADVRDFDVDLDLMDDDDDRGMIDCDFFLERDL
jgi:hypothetical protein